MSEKWHTVKNDRKGKKDGGQSEKQAKTYRPVGLQQSNTAFSQWSALEQSREGKNAGSEESQEDRAVEGKSRREGIRHRGKGKSTEKKTKILFDQAVGELDATYLMEYVEKLKSDNSESPLVWLKELTTYLQMQFKDVHPDTDYTLSNRDPAYPASALSVSLHSQLVSNLRGCPPLALESLFRHCVNCLLGEVQKGVSSHGSRIVIQLIREARPRICAAVSESIQLSLQSCGTKVAETLSLLWAGLPDPKSDSSTSLVAWHQLVLPFLCKVTSCPKQVLSYCLNYTSLLLSCLVPEERSVLAEYVPPATLCAVLSSPAIVSRRTDGNVQEICQHFQEYLLSDEFIVMYFMSFFVELGQTENNELLIDFALHCLCRSSLCLSSWKRVAPKYLNSSKLLLTELAQNWTAVSSQLEPASLNSTLTYLASNITVNEHRQLCQDLLRRIPVLRTNQQGVTNSSQKCSCVRILCGLLLLVAAIGYLGILAIFLVHVATHGPDLEVRLFTKIMSPAEWRSLLDGATDVMWQCHVWALSTLNRLIQILTTALT